MRKMRDLCKKRDVVNGPGGMTKQELAQLAQDVDKRWTANEALPGVGQEDWNIGQQFQEWAELAPEVVMGAIHEFSSFNDEVALTNRLGALGIAYGELTPNKGIPGGVYGVWRSDTPMILATPDAPPTTNRAYEIARAIGDLIYRQNEASALALAQQLEPNFVMVAGSQNNRALDA